MSTSYSNATKLFRTMFSRRADGVWAIEAFSPLELSPAEPGAIDFFSVQEDIFHVQPKTIGTIHWAVGQSIVPIVAMTSGPETFMRCLGTGFFISCSGLLITAAHVMMDPAERGYGNAKLTPGGIEYPDVHLGVMLKTNPVFQPDGYIFREIEWSAFLAEETDAPLPIRGLELRLTADTAICKVRPLPGDVPYQPLSIIQPGISGVGLAPGKTATAVGYGGMTEIVQFNTPGSDLRFVPQVSKGTVLERFPNNATTREASTPGACFSAEMAFPGGMSGSPIFDDERIYVHGVVSKGWEDDNGPMRFGYGSMLSSVLGLRLAQLGGKSVLDLMESSDHGIPKLSIPDA